MSEQEMLDKQGEDRDFFVEADKTDDTVIYRIGGRLDAISAQKVLNEYEAGAKAENIIVDLSSLKYAASSGLRVFLIMRKAASSFKIINCTKEVRDIFELTGFYDILNVE